ncbi:hypothetical protein BpHYR1_027015 [Brachionus plicatilis]|uniref:Uncharacterized protein n=1 Tax=Brachionus plicatilis TaxID=10195 RepID=A0A3M7SP90_BRAPC|nr:hypothetical protein BpHYR1_027015 [Brachionus plicatilis]
MIHRGSIYFLIRCLLFRIKISEFFPLFVNLGKMLLSESIFEMILCYLFMRFNKIFQTPIDNPEKNKNSGLELVLGFKSPNFRFIANSLFYTIVTIHGENGTWHQQRCYVSMNECQKRIFKTTSKEERS